MKIALYGLFDTQGKCRYVGATANPKKRELGHKFTLGVEHKHFAQLRVFRWVSEEQAWNIEPQIIRAYWRRGESDWNKKLSPRPYVGRPKPFRKIKLKELYKMIWSNDINHWTTLARIIHLGKQAECQARLRATNKRN